MFKFLLKETIAYATRKETSGKDLAREMDTNPDPDNEDPVVEEKRKGFFGKFRSYVGGIIKGISRLIGWVIDKVLEKINELFSWGWTTLVGWIIGAAEFVFNFDWNILDSEIEANVKALRNNVIASAGDALGNALGQFICGVLPATGAILVNEQAAIYALRYVGEEVYEEIISDVGQLINISIRSVASARVQLFYKNNFKSIAQNFLEESKFGKFLGYDRNKPFIISEAVSDLIQKIPNDDLKLFVENFYESFLEGCQEGAYCVANAFDSYLMMQNSLKRAPSSQYYYVLEIPD